MSKFKSDVDVAVLLLFFTRTEITKRTFEQIRKARPSRLYLYQDGARPGRHDDVGNIAKCRETIESMIDWECEVHRKYQDNNFGCDPSEYISQKWMFETEEKGIIIEDDDVMSVSFFRFCKELLDKYENDTRINIICGMNHLDVYEDCPYDYLFSRRGGAIWGWATWRRVVDRWDSEYKFINDNYSVECLKSEFGTKDVANLIESCQKHHATGREHYETILGASCWLNMGVNIVPKRNMTCNIGVGAESTHSAELYKLSRATRKNLNKKIYELDFPLRHPVHVQPDYKYERLMFNALYGTRFERMFQLRRIESIIYRIFPALGKWTLKHDQ